MANHFATPSLRSILCDPYSNSNVENVLDVVAALVWDCNFQSAKNSRAIQSFVQRFSELANFICSQRTKFTDFELVKVIGQGGFGRVQLVRHKATRRVYAMKTMSKQHLLDHSQSGYWEERDIMVKATSEWLVTCHQAFVDKENIYLCMEYMPGGDLYYWLEYYDTFTEEQARFYLAEIVLALEALHDLGYIHRDLKPDNMLLDAQGHLKLADFGSCVRLDSQGRYFCSSPIGTPDYISPEMLNCQSKAGYIGPACDWWALGVIAFEMLFGETAFYGQSLVETYSRILGYEKSLKIPTDTEITANFESLIRDFLRGADDRLGSNGGANEVKQHPFFESIDWLNLHSIAPPIKPVVTSDVDTSNINFDESEILGADAKFCGDSSNSSSGSPANLPRTPGAFAAKKSVGPPAYFTGDNLAFAGFTFNREERQRLESSTKVAMVANGDANTAEMKASLAEVRAQLSTAEKQAAMDKIAVNEAQRRLDDTKAELQTARAELERMGEETRTQVSVIQSERDTLCERANRLQTELMSAAEELELERKALAAVKEELTSVKAIPSLSVGNEMKQRSSPNENTSLQADLEEARQQACRAEAELVNTRRLHAQEMGELLDQLQAAKTFSQLYKSKLAEAEAEMESLRSHLTSVQASCKELKECNFSLESKLAMSEVDLDGLKKSYDTDLKEATTQVTRLKERVSIQASEISTVTEQREDLRQRCMALEDSVSNLTDQLQILRKENNIQHIKLEQTVTKLYEVASVVPTSGKKKKSTEAARVASLEKQLRNAEHRHQKEIADLQSTLNRLKTDNEEKAKAMAELTESNRMLEQELERMDAQMNTLYECYVTKSGTGGDLSSSSSLTGMVAEPSSLSAVGEISHSSENLSNDDEGQLITQQVLPPAIEGVCDFPEKIKGKKRLAWIPRFVVICPFSVSFFTSKPQRGSVPCEEIQIQKIFSVRPGTVLDLTYATEDDASRLICIISDKITSDFNTNDPDLMSIASTSSVSGGSGNATGNISWQGHSFQPITFRITNTICEVCRRPCSDLRSPPPALECIRCRMRIHRNHVENHEKFVVCPNTVKQWIIRAPSPADRNAWISCINQLKKEAGPLICSESLHSPGCLSRSSQPGAPLLGANTTRYRSMRNCGGRSLKDAVLKRSFMVTFPRHNSSSGVTGSVATRAILQSPPASASQHSPANFDGQHDL
ncbi:Rho-associated protein kinase [Echinococcus granulosus]|uniref:non-specific serine/threonine protein kinase n=1 Tax=Echinococcus granulosus TaxID=6210 RepID=A0A068WS79_ECHGR|nr:Rho-associated protein kinase [Echinococcus granulosus]CDS22666.1 rho-associated protein kinase 1 [Echinococcus granulosus]